MYLRSSWLVRIHGKVCPKHNGSEHEINQWLDEHKAAMTNIVVLFELPNGRRQRATFGSYVTAPDLAAMLMKHPELCAAIGVEPNQDELDRLLTDIDENGSQRISMGEWQVMACTAMACVVLAHVSMVYLVIPYIGMAQNCQVYLRPM